MIQYRIVEKYNNLFRERKFYPQIKKKFFWKSLKVHDQQTIENFYNTYDEAKEFLLSRIPKVLFHCVEHPTLNEPIIYHIKTNFQRLKLIKFLILNITLLRYI